MIIKMKSKKIRYIKVKECEIPLRRQDKEKTRKKTIMVWM